MRRFSDSLTQFSCDMHFITGHLANACSDASDMMQDKTGQDALRLLMGFVEDMRASTMIAENLADNIIVSATLIEESDTYI